MVTIDGPQGGCRPPLAFRGIARAKWCAGEADIHASGRGGVRATAPKRSRGGERHRRGKGSFEMVADKSSASTAASAEEHSAENWAFVPRQAGRKLKYPADFRHLFPALRARHFLVASRNSEAPRGALINEHNFCRRPENAGLLPATRRRLRLRRTALWLSVLPPVARKARGRRWRPDLSQGRPDANLRARGSRCMGLGADWSAAALDVRRVEPLLW